ncbi:protoporphyrinogen oxidase [Paenibacillus sp. N1-5-1-14]|uniref:protoporphyrinogen oxidase n=1 Tax=Paenibacillus radicibacter TaxID=2972488 RepID=UPI0021594259|nr:protoporphyrinogen oxidase [Paenibacillus radicibacter]MCR8644171.1 protoporphyrinogen oxidase [Paenibacillus radicibacter]
MELQTKKIAVIGGGITGLSAAYYVHKQLEKQGLEAEIQVYEASPHFGGKIHTKQREGILFEKGPDSFLSRKLPIIELTKELGLEGELTGTNPDAKKTYILHRGELHPMPDGLVLGIPSKISPFIGTSLISPAGKLRALMDLILPRRDDIADESLGDFLERRLGSEVLDRIAEPLLAGIYAGDTHELSLQATFPQFANMERKYRSLILGTMRAKKAPQPNLPSIPSAAGKSMFMTYRKGLKTLVDGLLGALQDHADLYNNIVVDRIVKQVGQDSYELFLSDGTKEIVHYVIIALPAYQTAKLLADIASSAVLDKLEYVSVANVVLAYKRDELNYNFDGSGFVIPRSEKRFITACTFTSEKWLHTAPKDKVLIRCYVGRSGQQEWTQLTEEQMVQRVRQDLQEIMGIQAEPLFTEVTPLHRSMPQYGVGHLDRIETLRNDLKQVMPHVWATGACFHGVGLPDCIRQGREAAEYIVGHMKETMK